mgnify:CR=1 FL=1
MKAELQSKLYAAYPIIFAQKDLDMTKTAMCWGISCGDGWYDLINELCENIQNHVNNFNRNKPEEAHMVCQATQVKEKFGGLCFYTYGGDEYIDGMISFAESMSYHICTDCGQRSAKNESNRGWIYTLCNSCKENK